MGYNTVAVILDDQMNDLERDPNSGKRISDASKDWCYGRDVFRGDFGYGSIISQDHADGYQVVVVHGNCGWSIGDIEKDKYLEYSAFWQMKECLERNGYKVTKQRVKK